jgi:hypothetical protein
MGYVIGAVLKAIRRGLRRRAGDDAGQTILIVAAVLLGAALTAIALIVNLDAGRRIVERLKSGNASQGQALPAVIAYYYKNSTVPCPDTASPPTGSKAATCDGTSTANAGALPWKDLGLSRDQALDAYGNFYTYVVSTDASDFCETIPSSYKASETTGTLKTSSLKVQDSSGVTNQIPFAIIGHGANGLGARTVNNTTTSKPSSTYETYNCDPAVSTCSQVLNMGQASGKPLVSGPFTGSQGTSAFDDQVFVPSKSVLQKVCQSLTPGGALNADLSDTFAPPTSALTNNAGTNTKLDANKYSADTANVTRTTDSTNAGNQVASFAGAGAILTTNTTNYNFDPRIRPLYVSALWTPVPGTTSNTQAGMSIVTRATPQDQTSGSDEFGANGKHGITFRFSERSGSNNVGPAGPTNHVYVCNDDCTTPLASSGTDTYQLFTGKSYLIEAYDDGAYVWGRITQTDDATNTATVGPTSTSADLDGNNQIAFVGGANTSYLDNVVAGFGMLALETDGSSTGYVTTGASNLGLTGSLTVEAWIRPRAVPASGARAAILGTWDPSLTITTNCRNSFRLFVTGSTAELDICGLVGATATNETHSVPFAPTLNAWDHLAAVYDASAKTVTFYINGEQAGSVQSSSITAAGIQAGDATLPFLVGSVSCATSGTSCSPAPYADPFTGDISDVRVWNAASFKDASNASVTVANQMLGYYNRRLSYVNTTAETGLSLNWKFDAESGPFASTGSVSSTGSSANTTGTLQSGAKYIAALANYYRRFASTVHDAAGQSVSGVCPSGTVASSYQCDFRQASQSATFTLPANIYAAYAKMWGGGGGGFNATITGLSSAVSSAGGGGGYSGASLAKISTTALANQSLDVAVGGGGKGSNNDYSNGSGNVAGTGKGAGGGGASVIRLASSTPGLVAGGGGGASFSNNFFPTGVTTACDAVTGDPMVQCGIGGAGGGAGANSARSNDAAQLKCGGRDGFNWASGGKPPDTTYCPTGGTDPTNSASPLSTTGGTGGGTYKGGDTKIGSTVIASGGDGTDAGSSDGGAGAGGGGGGISNGTTTAGGGEAGGQGVFAYDTVTIGGSVVVGDVVTITFTNPSTTIDFTATDTLTSTVASGLVTGANGANNNATLTANNISASANGSVVTFYRPSANAATTTISGSATANSNFTVTRDATNCAGGAFTGSASSATCQVDFGPASNFAAHSGDTITLTFSNANGSFTATTPCTFIYTVSTSVNGSTGVGDTSAANLATNVAYAINNGTGTGTCGAALTNGTGYGISAGTAGANMTLTATNFATDTSLAAPTIDTSGGTTGESFSYAHTAYSLTTFIPSGRTSGGTPTATGSSNGFGGGGGSGFKDTNAKGVQGQAGLSKATATVDSITASQTAGLTFTNSGAFGSVITVSTPVAASGDTTTTVAQRLASLITTDSTLSTKGVSATSAGNVITIVQQGPFTQPYVSNTTIASTGTGAAFTFSPSSGIPAAGAAGGTTDFHYAPSAYTTNPNTTPGKGGASGGDGSAGAIVLFW